VIAVTNFLLNCHIFSILNWKWPIFEFYLLDLKSTKLPIPQKTPPLTEDYILIHLSSKGKEEVRR
jgi:hypothetical protein